MKNLIVFCISILVTTTSFACNYAIQNRIFPLGTVDGKLVIAEFNMARGDDRQQMVYWEANGNVYKINDDYSRDLLFPMEPFKFYDSEYVETIEQKLKDLTANANRVLALGKIKNQDAFLCQLSNSCMGLDLNTAHTQEGLQLTKDGQKVQVPLQKQETANGFGWQTINALFMSGFLMEDEDIADYFKLGSVRYYQQGEKQFAIVHLAHTPHQIQPAESATQLKINPEAPFGIVHHEEVLLHGKGFDLVVYF